MNSRKKVKVLVVDDEQIIRDFLTKLLTLEDNVEVMTAESGIKAVELAKSESFDMFFIDVRMPVMDGVETYSLIKRMAPEAKYIMMTGYSLDDLLKRLEGQNIEAVLTKPFEIKEIVGILDDYAREKYPEQIISVLIVENEEAVSHFFARLLESYDITAVKTGKEALEHIARKNFDLILSNIMLNDMTGVEFYGKVREIKPGAAIILVTGDVKKTEGAIKDTLSQQIKNILNKPT